MYQLAANPVSQSNALKWHQSRLLISYLLHFFFYTSLDISRLFFFFFKKSFDFLYPSETLVSTFSRRKASLAFWLLLSSIVPHYFFSFLFGLSPKLDVEPNEKMTLVQKGRWIISERRGVLHHIEPSHLWRKPALSEIHALLVSQSTLKENRRYDGVQTVLNW